LSPTVFKEGKYRFHFFSREEARTHVHIVSPDGEAKFWLEPTISLANYSGFSKKQLNFLQKVIQGHKNEIIKKWKEHLYSISSEHRFGRLATQMDGPVWIRKGSTTTFCSNQKAAKQVYI